MDKIKKFEKIIIETLEAERIERPNSDVRDIVLSDYQQRHYQLIRTGW